MSRSLSLFEDIILTSTMDSSPASSVTYGNSSRIPDPSRESLGKVFQEPSRPQKIRYLSIIARLNRGATASQLSCDLYAATGTRVSRLTVSKRLRETGLFARPAVCIPLTSMNRRVHLAWC
ncbi:hypothetical protein AVEN_53741-1 [Araneus ventricosus]|uniref:Transposase Tc1-like domain-containing protein n=1 Tax=Araneus ventricosus TaxID=182803 RepID=A0A4Y2AU24_ARAVE|nr:hypothetical protein AVEN_239639-1 [Araneus ventricosus]GBL83542.1 hypothetical protein AVEN_53741-1 [Araneus ventricosus]